MTRVVPFLLENDGFPDAHSQTKTICHENGMLEFTQDVEVSIDYPVSNLDGSVAWQATAQRLAERLIQERLAIMEFLRRVGNFKEKELGPALAQIRKATSNREALIARKKLEQLGRIGELFDPETGKPLYDSITGEKLAR